MTPLDMPQWLHHRTISASALYDDIKASDDVAMDQVELLAVEVARHLHRPGLRPASSETTPLSRDQILRWDGATQPRSIKATANMLDHALRQVRANGHLLASNRKGKTQRWRSFLKWLSKEGVLVPHSTHRGAFLLAEGHRGLLDES